MDKDLKTSVEEQNRLSSANAGNPDRAVSLRSHISITSSTDIHYSAIIDEKNSGFGMPFVKRELHGIAPEIIESRQELEEIIDYGTAKTETQDVLETITDTGVVQQELVKSVSVGLSNRLGTVKSSKIVSLINALAPVDEYLQRHCINVGLINGLFGKWLGMSKDDVDTLVLAGLLHDCGKALVPARILQAPRKLTVSEYEVIKMHSLHSYALLEEFPDTVRRAARNHHESFDGGGYPDYQSELDISLFARISSISDVYDAIVSQRAYKKASSPFHALDVIARCRGSDLDPSLVDVFFKRMLPDLVDKPVIMSDGTVGIVRDFNPACPKYPTVEVNGQVIESDENWFCVAMYIEE